jgi:MerR family mercuric resistance operon transcriptional regulator/MerR family gold-responsive transcriptional activator of gol and ges genes
MVPGRTIGRAAKEVGVNIQTIRYYERLNLLNPSARRPSGYRIYGDEEVRRLRFIKNAQALGFTLREITDLLSLRVRSTAQCSAVQRKARAKLAQVERKVRDLQALAQSLRSLIRACESGQPTDHCPIVESLEDQRRKHHGDRPATS